MNWLTPKPGSLRISSKPPPSPAGRPCAASLSRASLMRSCGTMTAPVPESTLYSMPADCSACTTLAASSVVRLAYSSPQFGPCDQIATVTPAATAAAIPSSTSSGRKPAPMPAIGGWESTAALVAMVDPGQREVEQPSDRHVHDFLVGRDKAVAHFGRGAERHARLLHLDHHLAEFHA